MRLKQLKLVGFKSFVDAVTIPLPSQLVAVVGPNGCGKSNVIDAVRWVMGESQAKQLRGEAMTDVIFKGSSHRKSVGQASVELIFDNHLGKLSGACAQYQEVSIKRTVNRDGDSSYFLNGVRCRRRDITEVFLGTGVGARGYSVIGQETISRLIEARPEELRAHLEEAAGVSKYKERRRETLQRMAQTRENLARVADIQSELTKQLAKLERQAISAKKYTQYQEEARTIRFAIHALKWKSLEIEQYELSETKNKTQRQLDYHQTQIAEYIKNRAHQSLVLDELVAHQQSLQNTCYQLKTDLVRLEETIQNQQQRHLQLLHDSQQLIHDEQQYAQQLKSDEMAFCASETQLLVINGAWQEAKMRCQFAQEQVQLLEEQNKIWQANWQKSLHETNDVSRDLQIKRLEQQNLQAQEMKLTNQYERHQQSLLSVNLDALSESLKKAEMTTESAFRAHQSLQNQHQELLDATETDRCQLSELDKEIQAISDTIRLWTEEHAALYAAQSGALKTRTQNLSIGDQKRVVEAIFVEERWRVMAELVMGESLQSVVVENFEPIYLGIESIQGQTNLYSQPLYSSTVADYPRLSDQITGLVPQWFIQADQIFTADSLEQALSWLSTIAGHQSIITPDGFWIGHGWLRVYDLSPEDEMGVLARQYAIKALSEKIEMSILARQNLFENRARCQEHFELHQQKQKTTHRALLDAAETLRQAELFYAKQEQTYRHVTTQFAVWNTECGDILRELEEIANTKLELNTALSALEEQKKVLGDAQNLLQEEHAQVERSLMQAKNNWQDENTSSQHLATQYHQEVAKQHHLQQQIARVKQQLDQTLHRQKLIQQQLTDLIGPMDISTQTLHEKIAEHDQIEAAVLSSQSEVECQRQCLQKTDQLCHHEEQQVKSLQATLQTLFVNEQALLLRSNGYVERLSAMRSDWQSHLTSLVETLTIEQYEKELDRVEANIARLGPINLLAIEEYETDLTRKMHLESQERDLTEALQTLENAIARMDQETRQRFKQTFDEVNQAFQKLFPRLFGGGHATLEMTCDNLLEAGVLVMAQPPGKRNNTIYMLSGGEKAMTAVALVFAIFQLNPSPFCMLDEVDAPLDESNVRRFCELVREMSHVVQFLLITHNKVTMEIANQLIGVTMREPGVSRIVSVDVTTMT